MATKKRGLGRGLDALLGASKTPPAPIEPSAIETPESAPRDGQLKNLPIEKVQRGRYQPRQDMDPEALESLANSIRAQGIMQPIVVRPIAADKYEIIAGERRWRAAQAAGLDTVPALIRDVPDEAAIAMALIENIQREDLNPMEEAVALQRLQQEFSLSQQQVADAVGKSRSTIANLLRLMQLQADVRVMLERGDLEMGHARALLALPDGTQSKAARQVVDRGLSVRQTEALVRRLAQESEQTPQQTRTLDPNVRQLQDHLSERLGTRVEIKDTGGKGRLILSYNSLDELDGILSRIQ